MSSAIRVLEELVRPEAPGPFPCFSKLHVVKALASMARSGSIGRAGLAQVLGLGEGATRTLIGKLSKHGLVEVTRRGCSLTERGKALWKEICSKLPKMTEIKAIPVPGKGFAVLVRGEARNVRLGINQRDEAVRAGARGAMILVFEQGKLRMPGVSEDVSVDFPELFEEVMSVLEPKEGDVVVVAFADSDLIAEYGALAAALSFL